LKRKLRQTNALYAPPGSNKVFNVALCRKFLLTPVANYGTIHGHCSQQSALLYLLPQYGRRKDFFPGMLIAEFFQNSQKDISKDSQKW